MKKEDLAMQIEITEAGILAVVATMLTMPLESLQAFRELQRSMFGERDPMHVAMDTILMVRHVQTEGREKYERHD